MRHSFLVPAALLAAILSAGAQESPYAQRAPTPGAAADAQALGDLMLAVQQHHAKLWLAGKAGAWPLAAYEAERLRGAYLRAAELYQNLPVDLVVTATQPVNEIVEAAKARDAKAFTAAFGRLTGACNGCHAAGGVGFVVIRTPRGASFGNQSFEADGRGR